MTLLRQRVQQFADLLTARRGQDLDAWMTAIDADDLPAVHGFVHGLRKDLPAVVAGLTLPYSNGPIEGATPRSNSSNGKCMAAPASRSYDTGSC